MSTHSLCVCEIGAFKLRLTAVSHRAVEILNDSSTILVTFKRHCADARPIGPGAHVGAARSPRSPLRAAAPAGAAADSQGLLSVRRSNLQTFKVTIVKDRNNKA